MLKDENNNRLYFQSDVFCSLMKSDDRSIKELKEIIAKKACVSTHAVKRWQLGKNSPSGLDIVNVIAEVLNVEPEILVGRNKPEYKNDSIQKDNVHIENNEHEEQEINCDLSWNTIRSIFKKKPYLRYKIRAFLLLIYGSNVYLSWWDKISILYNGKKDGDEQLRMCLSEICSFAKRNSCNQIDAFIDGNVQVAINQRRILKTKMDFLEISKGFLFAYLKDLKGYNLNILELYYGKTELSPDICDDIENFIYDVKKQRLDYMFPIANIESKEKFKPLSASKAVNFVTWGIPVLLTPEIGFLARKNRANELNKFETRSGIKMFNKGNIKLLSDTTLYELCKSFDIASGCPIIMNDNSYTGDVELKERVEAYAYENNVSIIYLKEA